MVKIRHFDSRKTLEGILLTQKKRYQPLLVKNRNSLFRDIVKKRVVKIFAHPLKQTHSKFLFSLLTDSGFVNSFCPHLISLLTITYKDDSEHNVNNGDVNNGENMNNGEKNGEEAEKNEGKAENNGENCYTLLIGYIMKEGTVLNRRELQFYLRKPAVRKLWHYGIQKYKFYYNDFKAQNLIKDTYVKGQIAPRNIGLIDLEALYPLPEPHVLTDPRNIRNVQRKIELYDMQWYYDAVKITMHNKRK